MFRDGQYLEVIKASDDCLATAIVTVQERRIEIKNKTVSTNKWLEVEDWAALYKIVERAILRNVRALRLRKDFEKYERKKYTRQLEITYTFELAESPKDVTSLPTIRVNVSHARKKSEKAETFKQLKKRNKDSPDQTLQQTPSATCDRTPEEDDAEFKISTNKDIKESLYDTKKSKVRKYDQLEDIDDYVLEEYVPDVPSAKKLCAGLKYVPSNKSALEGVQISSNEYTPMVSDNKNTTEVIRYVPNSVVASKVSYDTYQPCGAVPISLSNEYVPTSKGVKASVEEYQPDFTSKSMKFDDSYIPSSVQLIDENLNKPMEEYEKYLQKHAARRKETKKKQTSFS